MTYKSKLLFDSQPGFKDTGVIESVTGVTTMTMIALTYIAAFILIPVIAARSV